MSSSARHFVAQSKLTSLVPLLKRNLAKQPPPRHDAPIVRASVAAVFRWKEKEQRTLELLLVRRAVNEKDWWSGQVAFPGGRRQKKTRMDLRLDVSEEWSDWESLRETAERETMEEVGLDLTLSHVHWIGNLPAIPTNMRSLAVSTQVFFVDVAAKEHEYEPKAQESEIADVFWVDVQELFNMKRYHELVIPLEKSLVSVGKSPRLVALGKKVLGDMLFDCIYLPRPGHETPDEARLPRRDVEDFVLWGFTLGAIMKLFAIGAAPLPMREVSFRFESGALLGDAIAYCYRFPDKALAGGATVTALLLVSVLYSSL